MRRTVKRFPTQWPSTYAVKIENRASVNANDFERLATFSNHPSYRTIEDKGWRHRGDGLQRPFVLGRRAIVEEAYRSFHPRIDEVVCWEHGHHRDALEMPSEFKEMRGRNCKLGEVIGAGAGINLQAVYPLKITEEKEQWMYSVVFRFALHDDDGVEV